MSRTTIDFGIDLGTTNSEIAVFNGTSTEVVKNNENFENTPSAIWINRDGEVEVGAKAKEEYGFDKDNAKIEFKRQMGQPQRLHFKASGRSMLPEEASAEVLKQLRANVNQWMGEDITAAVITVPAKFGGAATDATTRAARLAGFELSPLLQEPAAAATAYGFQQQSQSTTTRWMIYDLGGGTFDAALVQNDDGLLKAIGCGGDEYLGGKDMDDAIVRELLVPALLAQVPLGNFTQDNDRWRRAFALLKFNAEVAKISLSRRTSTHIDIRNLCKNDDGREVDFFYEFQRRDLERLVEPIVAKTINICKAELAKRRLAVGDIEKLILVGGPTLMPCVREHLKAELGIPLEFRVDPFTVVARGAAIFAATQPLPPKLHRRAGEYQIELDYKAIGPDVEPIMSGTVFGVEGQEFSGFTIEFLNRDARPPWRSGKIGLSPEGKFLATLWAEKGRPNCFTIELLDTVGTRQVVAPDEASYTVSGGILDTQTLIHNIGVGLRDNTVGLIFEAGAQLPTRRKRLSVQTGQDVQGGSADTIRIPFLEGNEMRASRNVEFDAIEIPAKEFRRDVPAGSEVQLTIHIDSSRNCYAKVYLPVLDEEFPEFKLERKNITASVGDLVAQYEAEKLRLAKLREKAGNLDAPQAQQALLQVDGERLDHSVESSLAAANSDRDAAATGASRLRDLQIALDRVEDELRWPALVAQADSSIEAASSLVVQYGSSSDKTQMASLVSAIRSAIQNHEEQVLVIQCQELNALTGRVFLTSPAGIVSRFHWLQDDKGQMRDEAAAERLIAQGVHALQADNLAQLQAINNQLAELLPRAIRDAEFNRSSVLMLNSGR